MQGAKKYSIKKMIRVIWFSAVAIFFIWNWSTFQSRNLPANCFITDRLVTVTQNSDEIVFRANAGFTGFEVIFFQGGLTDPKAYGPLCRRIAESGFTCHLVKMNWRLPQIDYKKISRLYDFSRSDFVIGGHSQGAKMAAQFTFENPSLIKGIFLLATSHPRDIDMSGLSIPAIKIYAEKDGLASVDEVLGNKNKLPAGAKLLLIRGGNHSQFGYLGRLFLDDKATISLGEQQKQTFKLIIEFLNEIKKG